MSNIYANKSTASRVLGQMGVPKELRAELITGDCAPFEINEKAVRKVLKSLKEAKEENAQSKASAERAVTEMFENDRKDATRKAEDALIKAVPVSTPDAAPAEQAAASEPVATSSTVKPEQAAARSTARKGNPRQNGKARPSKGVCCAIWDELDKFFADMNGQIPTPAEAQQMGIANNWHKVTVYRQYNDWMVFHGHK